MEIMNLVKDEITLKSMTFTGLGVSEALAVKLADYGILEPTAVQAECIPAALEGKDILAESQTGTGKTLAYLLPMLQRIQPEDKTLQALVLAPTQELAMQIVREAEKYGESLGISVQALIGGAAIKRQLERLRLHPQLVVGTPGRIREVLALRKLKLHTVRTVVVDEVDQMFQLGGTADLEQILRGTLRDRQLMFLSATLNPEIRALAAREMKDPQWVGITPEQRTSQSLEHVFFECEQRDKIDNLRRILRHYNPARSIVFINNTQDIAEVEGKLNFLGFRAGALYGDADKSVRSHTLRKFREGKIQVLVATDIAARGLDIEELSLVVNLDPPIDSEHYVHRAGRTGRMGRHGLAVSIINPKERFIIRKFARELNIGISEQRLFGGRVIEAGAETERAGANGHRNTSANSNRENEQRKPSDELKSSPPAKAKARHDHSQLAEPKESRKRPSKAPRDKEIKPAPNVRKPSSKEDRKNKGAPKWLKEKQSETRK